MKTVTVNLNSIEKVKSFVKDLNKFENDFDLVSGRFAIDAKSIMGIFALDLSKPLQLNIHSTRAMQSLQLLATTLAKEPIGSTCITKGQLFNREFI